MKKTYKLSEICSIKSGKRIPLGMDFVAEETNHPYIRARDIKGGKIQTDDLIYLTDDVHEKIKRYIINAGDIAITIVGASVGDVSYAQDEVDGYNLTENAVRLTQFNKNVNGQYLYYLLNQRKYHDYMQVVAGGAAQPKLGIYKVERIKVQLPDIDIQNHIVDCLEKYDLAIENNNKRIKILEQMAENLYKEWFVRFRFPGHEDVEFIEGRADEFFDITIGKTPSRQDFDAFVSGDDNAINWVSISDMKSMYIGNTNEQLTLDAVKNYNVVRVPEKTILLSFKLTVGRVAITTKESCTNEAIAHFKNVDEEYLEYLYLYLKLFDYNTLGNTSAIGNAINSKIVKAMNVKLPNIDIANRFHDMVGKVFDEILVLNNKNMNLYKQRDLLLPRLMSGKLQVK